MVGTLSHTARLFLALAVLWLPLNGLFCPVEADDAEAMACCRERAAHCNMPEKTEDCCNRGQASNDTVLTAPLRTADKQTPSAAASAPPTFSQSSEREGQVGVVASSLKFLPSQISPRATPLRI